MEGSEKEKMLSGELYRASDPELVGDRQRCRSLLHAFNTQPDEVQRVAVLRDLLGTIGTGSSVQPPFACDYGYNVRVGDNVFINFNIVLPGVSVGDDAIIGAGSVVTRDIPAGVVAMGTPCRVVRTL